MPRLALKLFSDFKINLNDEIVVGIKTNKARALLAYLALEANRSHSRSVLAEFFWPNKPAGAGRNSLKQALSNIRSTLEDQNSASPFLLVDREEIQFNSGSNYWIDTQEFAALIKETRTHQHQTIESCKRFVDRLRQAAELYQGDFLAQFSLPDSADFEEWVVTNREALQRQMSDAYRDLIAHEKHDGDYSEACQHAYRLVELEPWNEENHRELIDSLALAGRRSAALKHYRKCRQFLADELGVELAEETTELYNQIRDGKYKQHKSSSQEKSEEVSDLLRNKPFNIPSLVPIIILFLVLSLGLWAGLQNLKARRTDANSNNQTSSASFSTSSAIGLTISHDEEQVLTSIYNETEGSGWKNSSGWLSDTSPCTWFGVVCGVGSVVELNLADNNLSGNIPPEISLLTNLKTLNLEFNHLNGSIPPELGDLSKLEFMFLNGNSGLSGSIPPEIGDLTSLRGLILSSFEGGTLLSGHIPSELGNLRKLTHLEISNSLVNGPIPPELGQLTNLTLLNLSHSPLSGPIPPEIGNLVNLEVLALGEGTNDLGGSLPLSLVNLKKLRAFQFNNTDLCEPTEDTFQAWLNGLDELLRTDILCQTDEL
jgi:DNA-binding SARP family transcriptional activator